MLGSCMDAARPCRGSRKQMTFQQKWVALECPADEFGQMQTSLFLLQGIAPS